jgi:hypothetical protein
MFKIVTSGAPYVPYCSLQQLLSFIPGFISSLTNHIPIIASHHSRSRKTSHIEMDTMSSAPFEAHHHRCEQPHLVSQAYHEFLAYSVSLTSLFEYHLQQAVKKRKACVPKDSDIDTFTRHCNFLTLLSPRTAGLAWHSPFWRRLLASTSRHKTPKSTGSSKDVSRERLENCLHLRMESYPMFRNSTRKSKRKKQFILNSNSGPSEKLKGKTGPGPGARRRRGRLHRIHFVPERRKEAGPGK